MIKLTRVLLTAVLVLAAAAVSAQMAGEDPAETCGVCHEDLVARFGHTAHALDRPSAPTCTTCHGDGTQHMDEGGDPALIQVPRGTDGVGLCMTCHGDTAAAFHGPAAHTRKGVTCDSCHAIHPAGEAAAASLLTAERDQLCVSCHPRQERSFSRPFGHRLGRAGLACVSCHNPHGGAGERSLKVDRTGETVCVSCHAEKRGPFVFPHVTGVAGGCMSCHQPHGSSNPNALVRTRAEQLCLECTARCRT